MPEGTGHPGRIDLGGRARFAGTPSRRLTGYRQALRAAGIPREGELIRHTGYDRAWARSAVLELMTCDDRPTALLLPAPRGRLRIEGPADVLPGCLPDLDLDVRTSLLAGGQGPAALAALGEGLTPDGSSKPTRPAPGV
jgi:hypothetical protein